MPFTKYEHMHHIWKYMHKCNIKLIIEPVHNKTNKMTCAPSKDSDQPGHPPSLIRVFTVRMKKAWVVSYPLSAQRGLIKLGSCPGWSESLLGAQVILLVLLCTGSITNAILIPSIWTVRQVWANSVDQKQSDQSMQVICHFISMFLTLYCTLNDD